MAPSTVGEYGQPDGALRGVRSRGPLRTLTEQQLASYRADGFLLLEDHFSREEMAELSARADEVSARVAEERGAAMGGGWGGAWREDLMVGEDEENSELLSIHDMQYQDAAFARLLLDERLTEPLADLLGDDLQLHHVKYHAKPPSTGTMFPMHMDFFYFPHELDTMTAYVIYMDEATIENGCLCVYPGSHAEPVPAEAPDGKYLPPTDYPLERARPCPGPAGSVLIFNYRTIHGSYPNKSDTARRMILYQVRSPTDRPLSKAHNTSGGQGMMLRGARPARAARSPHDARL